MENSRSINQGKFESLEHTVYGGVEHHLPLWVDRESGLTDESNALLHAANLIGGKLHQYNDGVQEIYKQLERHLKSEDSEGWLLADDSGKGSLTVTPDVTTVTVHDVNTWEIPTNLLMDMLGNWVQLTQEEL
jgi:hypothetical protein